MLSFHHPGPRYGRREFLRVGGLGLGGLSLSGLLQAQAAAASGGSPVTGKSVVFLFMHGGPSQIETFDPKMSAPSEIRSVNGEVQTKLAGVTFGAGLPRLATLADRLTIVRSYTTGDGRHDIKPVVCPDTFGANMGSIYSRVVGANHPRTGMPTNALLFPRAVDESTMPGIKNFGDFESAGTLGRACAPFVPSGGGEMKQNMKLAVPMDRLHHRRELLAGLDRIKLSLDRRAGAGGLDKMREQAFSTILGGVADAFDLSQEAPETIARYDTAPLVHPEHIDKKWNNHSRYADNAKSLGKLMLLARRLCEAGCGFVTVTTNFVWDMHADANNAGVEEGMRYMGLPFDHAVSAFLEDVERRGLSDKILLVCSGEMGRTPRINNRGGRDHWGNLAPLMLAGGGLRMGQVIGQSTRDAGEPISEPCRIKNLVGTIMHTLFDVGELRIAQRVPTDITRAASDWEPIPGLLV